MSSLSARKRSSICVIRSFTAAVLLHSIAATASQLAIGVFVEAVLLGSSVGCVTHSRMRAFLGYALRRKKLLSIFSAAHECNVICSVINPGPICGINTPIHGPSTASGPLQGTACTLSPFGPFASLDSRAGLSCGRLYSSYSSTVRDSGTCGTRDTSIRVGVYPLMTRKQRTKKAFAIRACAIRAPVV